jgi:ABC-type antimicrobial peptide transport system permease subunit
VSRLRTLLSRAFGWVGSRKRDADLHREISSHIDEAAEEHARRGVPADEARRLAFAQFGGVTQAVEAHRDRRRFRPFGSFGRDLVYGLRMFTRPSGFSLAAVLTLAIGILANTTIVSGVNAVLFRPLAIEKPAQVHQIFNGTSSTDGLNTLADSVKGVVRKLDPAMPISEVRKGEDHISADLGAMRLTAEVAMLLGLVALTLASLGLYGVVSYAVGMRAREIGIRMALGARSTNVRGLIVRQGLLLTVVGLVIGLGGSLLLTPVLQSMLINLPSNDPWTFATVAIALSVIALVACYLPARRATRIDPILTLRSE